MAIPVSVVAIGKSTKKSDYDILYNNSILANTGGTPGGAQSIPGDKTFEGDTTFEGNTTFSGGMSVASTATFAGGMSVESTVTFSSDIQASGTITTGVKTDGTYLKTKVIAIGDWNMDTTAGVSIAHGLTSGNIRGISIIIRSDSGYLYTFDAIYVGYYYVTPDNVVLERGGTGLFDSTNFNLTSYNRGYVTIVYEA